MNMVITQLFFVVFETRKYHWIQHKITNFYWFCKKANRLMTSFHGIRHQRFQMKEDGRQRRFEQNPHFFKLPINMGIFWGLENSAINVCT